MASPLQVRACTASPAEMQGDGQRRRTAIQRLGSAIPGEAPGNVVGARWSGGTEWAAPTACASYSVRNAYSVRSSVLTRSLPPAVRTAPSGQPLSIALQSGVPLATP